MNQPVHILYVDDSPLDRELVRDALEKEHGGFKLVEAASRAEFETALNRGGFDLVLSDFNILGFEGLQVLETVRATGSNLPVIIVTGTGSEEVAAEAIKRGAADYVIKSPKHIQHLAHTIHTVLEKKRLETERTQALEALRKSEERYRRLHESMRDSFAQVKMSGEIVDVNPSYLEMLGYSEEEVLKLRYVDITPQRWHKVEQEIIDTQILPFGYSDVYEKEYIKKDGTVFPIELRTFLLRDAEGLPSGMWAIVRDITARKRAEDSLRESEEHYRSLVELSPDAIFIEEEDGTLAFVNPAGLRLFGATRPDQILGRQVFDLIHPDYRKIVKKRFQAIKKEKKELPMIEEKYLRLDGSSVDVEVAVTPFVYEGKRGAQVIAHDISERKKAEAEILRRMKDLQVLFDSSLALSSRFTHPEIGRAVIEILAEHMDWHHAVARIREEGSDELEIIGYAAPGVSPEDNAAEISRLNSLVSRSSQGMVGWVIQHGQGVRSGDLPSDPRNVETYPGIRSGIFTPMVAAEKVIGVISVESEMANAFDEHDERLLATLSKITANAIHRNHLREQTELQLKHLAALRAIDKAISASFDLHVTLEIFLNNAVTQLGADAALVLLVNPGMRMLEYGAEYGFLDSAVRKIHVRMDEGEAGRVVMERRVISIPDLRKAGKPLLHPELNASENFVSYHAVPLISKGQFKGLLEIFHRNLIEPSTDWLNFLETLAGQAAIAIDNNQLFESLQHSNFELAIAYDETIEGWSRAMDLRDHETEGHTQRVTAITQQLAVFMGLTETELVYARRGALLHDIGKMGVPDKILLKPGELTPEEWELMHQHPQFAHDMLAPITFLRPVVDIPYCHHEKWDGTGYPRGLKGKEIPISARIFALVDVYDALTSDRPYRRAWSKEQALDYIREQSGKHFDPQVVDTFLNVIPEIN
jgi:PAS domain S-box-containing protein